MKKEGRCRTESTVAYFFVQGEGQNFSSNSRQKENHKHPEHEVMNLTGEDACMFLKRLQESNGFNVELEAAMKEHERRVICK